MRDEVEGRKVVHLGYHVDDELHSISFSREMKLLMGIFIFFFLHCSKKCTLEKAK